MAGGKLAKVDRVEWVVVSDQQTAVNALLNGEVDLIEQPSFDLLPILEKDGNIQFGNWSSVGNQYIFRFNWLLKPFNNQKVRQAMWHALNQKDFLEAVIGDPAYYRVCKSMFTCGTPLSTEKGTEGLLESNFKKARELLKEGGYDGTPVVLLQATDRAAYANLAPVAKALLEQAGMKVDMQSMDWQTNVMRRAKKTPVSEGGWNISLTSVNNTTEPVSSTYLNSSCEKATFGWPCDKVVEDLRAKFAREPDLAKQKALMEQIQLREVENPAYIPLGEWRQPVAARKSIQGLRPIPVPAFWGLSKSGR
jgi:peptide/nickel transport system substrate-binding protein